MEDAQPATKCRSDESDDCQEYKERRESEESKILFVNIRRVRLLFCHERRRMDFSTF